MYCPDDNFELGTNSNNLNRRVTLEQHIYNGDDNALICRRVVSLQHTKLVVALSSLYIYLFC